MTKKVAVIVLGDIGRSPRMRNHAVALAKEGHYVTIIGYGGSALDNDISSNPNISIKIMSEPFTYRFMFKKYGNYIIKCLWQSLTLLWCIGIPDFILLQNPPAIPVLPFCYLYCSMLNPILFVFGKNIQLVLDWHNYAYSIMALSFNKSCSHPLVRLSRFIERSIGSRIKNAFCVSNAMKKDLLEQFGAIANTLYDKPNERFGPISTEESHKLFQKLAAKYLEFSERGTATRNCDRTAFTNRNGDFYSWNNNRPALLISSTSWTEDEDFGILLSALTEYDTVASETVGDDLPNLVCVITGKGPQKAHYCSLISKQVWRKVQIITPWLEPEDYPKLLASADLGVCLHTSSSGVDLPMKVVDMFGSELPVVAYKNQSFVALPELVIEGYTGKVFTSPEDLSSCLKDWFSNFLKDDYNERQNTYKNNIKASFKSESWETHWKKIAKPCFEKTSDFPFLFILISMMCIMWLCYTLM